jgi:hypothetical protein
VKTDVVQPKERQLLALKLAWLHIRFCRLENELTDPAQVGFGPLSAGSRDGENLLDYALLG